MTLEEIVDALCAADAAGKIAVRLHTGDPSLYGAIREQMDRLDAAGVAYLVVPGVSAFGGAAAALKAEYTVPGVSQSVIITRVEGRTAVPAGERLRDLASHGCTMVLFLSSGLLDKVEAELLAGGMAPTTPAAIVYKATWPDELVLRCDVGTLARTAREAGISKTAIVCVGDFLGDASERSRLYDPGFSHLFRAAAGAGDGEGVR
jgi:precorrin-4/cobalt-precorrin-4 C11-methyltransferase